MATPTSTAGCFFCQRTDRETRPYGPGGSALCIECMRETPEREEAAKRAFAVQLEAAEVVGQGVSVLGSHGPRASTQAERDLLEQEWLTG